jgi:Ser-tRNA(Ala) deacylase AlaX
MTKLNYLEDTYLFESEATFVEIRENEKGKAIILDETIFYPQGGGQPADRGEITSGDSVFTVNDVRLAEDGIVWHFERLKKETG